MNKILFNVNCIPVEIQSLNQITGKFIYLTKWYKLNGENVVKGEKLFQVRGGNQLRTYYTFDFDSEYSGVVDILKKESHGISGIKQGELLAIIYSTQSERFKNKFFNTPSIEIDDFTGGKLIKWSIVGGLQYPEQQMFIELKNPIGAIMSKSFDTNARLFYSFQYLDNKDFIVFNFFSKEYTLSKGDRISFLFDNGEKNEYTITTPFYKSNSTWDKLMENKIPITYEELKRFKELSLLKWKIEFKNSKCIVGGKGNFWYNDDEIKLVTKALADEYFSIVNKEIDNYQPFVSHISSSKGEDVETDSICYVYLMIDTTNGIYKIGISNQPEYRERTLQSDKPTIELICSKTFPTRRIAKSIESALHNLFDDKRIRGEWFKLDDKDVQEIRRTLE